MRISQEEKEKLRARILDEALPYLKKHGLAGAPVDEIMRQAGVTSGALYSHFGSKEGLFRAVVLRELERMAEELARTQKEHGARAWPRFLDFYLCANHVARPEEGCLFASLGFDLGKCERQDRRVFEEKLEAVFTVLAGFFSKGTPRERLTRARFFFSAMNGAVSLARSVQSTEAAQEILSATKKQLLESLRADAE